MAAPIELDAGVPALGYHDLPALLASMNGDEKHDLASHSTVDVLWVLYDRILRVTPETAEDPGRDRFLLSKGHGPMAYYAVLAAKGFLPVSALATFGAYDSPLGHHPDGALLRGVEIGSGSLGHGLPIAVGIAHGLRAQGRDQPRVVCLLGDGELDEGSNHEAIAYAGRAGLDRLTAVVVDNGSATWGWPGGIERRFELEGWATAVVDGRDHVALERALAPVDADRPTAVVALVGSAP